MHNLHIVFYVLCHYLYKLGIQLSAPVVKFDASMTLSTVQVTCDIPLLSLCRVGIPLSVLLLQFDASVTVSTVQDTHDIPLLNLLLNIKIKVCSLICLLPFFLLSASYNGCPCWHLFEIPMCPCHSYSILYGW